MLMFIEVITKEDTKVIFPVSRIYNVRTNENNECVISLFPLQKDGPEDYLSGLIKKITVKNSYQEIKEKLEAK